MFKRSKKDDKKDDKKDSKKDSKKDDKKATGKAGKSGSAAAMFGMNMDMDMNLDEADLNDLSGNDDDLLAELDGYGDDGAKKVKKAPAKKTAAPAASPQGVQKELTMDDISEDGLEDELAGLMGDDDDDILELAEPKKKATKQAKPMPVAESPQQKQPVQQKQAAAPVAQKPTSPAAQQKPTISPVAQKPAAAAAPVAQQKPAAATPQKPAAQQVAAQPQSDDEEALFLKNPHSADFMCSNEVLEFETNRLEKIYSQIDDPKKGKIVMDQISTMKYKMNMLIHFINNGGLTEEKYGASLQEGIKRDRRIRDVLMEANRDQDVALVKNRINLMVGELKELNMPVPPEEPKKVKPKPAAAPVAAQPQQPKPTAAPAAATQQAKPATPQQDKAAVPQQTKPSTGAGAPAAAAPAKHSSSSSKLKPNLEKSAPTDVSSLSSSSLKKAPKSLSKTEKTEEDDFRNSPEEIKRRIKELDPLVSQWKKRIIELNESQLKIKALPESRETKLLLTRVLRELRALQMNLAEVNRSIETKIDMPIIKLATLKYTKKRINSDLQSNQLEITFLDFENITASEVPNDKMTPSIAGEIRMNENLPVTKVATPNGKGITGTFEDNNVFVLTIDRESKSLKRFIEKKLTLDVFTTKGLFKTKTKIGSLNIPLAGLMRTCETTVQCPYRKGFFNVKLRMKTPVDGEDLIDSFVSEYILAAPVNTPTGIEVYPRLAQFYQEHSDNDLLASASPHNIIGNVSAGTPIGLTSPPVPRSTAAAAAAAATQQKVPPKKPAAAPVAQQPQKKPTAPVAAQQPQAAAQAQAQAQPEAQPQEDPFDVSCLVANSVLEAESEALKVLIAKAKQTKQDASDYEQRKLVVDNKMVVLVAMIQQERLTMEDYTRILNERIAKDTDIMKKLAAQGNNADAIKIQKRIKMMKEELEE